MKHPYSRSLSSIIAILRLIRIDYLRSSIVFSCHPCRPAKDKPRNGSRFFPRSTKYEVDDTSVHIPLIPQSSTVLLAEGAVCYLPASVLTDLISYIAFKVAPPKPIQTLHARLRSDHAMLSRPDVQTWFWLFGTGLDAIHKFRTFNILSLLENPTRLAHDVGITADIVQGAFLKIFKAAVRADAPKYERLSNRLLSNLLNGTYLAKPWWPTRRKQIVEEMIAYVGSLRTDAWQSNSSHIPAVLPDTFPRSLFEVGIDVTIWEEYTDENHAHEECADER